MRRNWNRLLDNEIASLVRQKRTLRAQGPDGEKLELYLEGTGQRFLKGKSLHLAKLKKELTDGTYCPRPVFRNDRVKGSGTEIRSVYSLCSRDYLVSRATARSLMEEEPVFKQRSARELLIELGDFLDAEYKSSHTNCRGALIRIDIKDYFDSIPAQKIRKKFADLGICARKDESEKDGLLEVLERLGEATISQVAGTKNPTKQSLFTPQGYPHSSAIAQWYIADIVNLPEHRIIKLILKEKKCKVFRYVDDILILIPNGVSSVGARLIFYYTRWLLARRGLKIHGLKDKSKSLIVETGRGKAHSVSFLGLLINFDQDGTASLTVPDKKVKERKTRIWKLFNKFFGENLAPEIKSKSKEERARMLHYRLLLDSAGCRYKGKSWGFVNYWGMSRNASTFVLLDRFTEKCRAEFDVPSYGKPEKSVTSEFMQSYKKIRSKNYHESIKFNYDTLNLEDKKRILIEVFGINHFQIKSMDDKYLDSFWHKTLGLALKEVPVGGYYFERSKY